MPYPYDNQVRLEYNSGGDTWVEGRAGRIIRWIAEHEKQVNATGKGEVRFCFAGKSLSVHTTNVDDKI